MTWTVTIHKRAAKNIRKLPKRVQLILTLLVTEIERSGPTRGKLARLTHHCHLKKGNPTYVAVWQEVDG